jgi:hypothetical protein
MEEINKYYSFIHELIFNFIFNIFVQFHSRQLNYFLFMDQKKLFLKISLTTIYALFKNFSKNFDINYPIHFFNKLVIYGYCKKELVIFTIQILTNYLISR